MNDSTNPAIAVLKEPLRVLRITRDHECSSEIQNSRGHVRVNMDGSCV